MEGSSGSDGPAAAVAARPDPALARPPVLRLSGEDNVVVALRPLEAGEQLAVAGALVEVRGPVPFGHKLALSAIPPGGTVVKYGEVIGRATAAIGVGEHVHVHNVVSARLPGEDPT